MYRHIHGHFLCNGFVYVADQMNYCIQKFTTADSQQNPANLSGKTFYIKIPLVVRVTYSQYFNSTRVSLFVEN